MKKLLIMVFVVALAGVVAAEVVMPRVVETRIERRASEEIQGAATIEADIDSFPLVSRLLITGTVNHLSVTLNDVVEYQIPFASVRFDLAGVDVDRSALLEQRVRVRSIDSATVTAEVTGGDVLGLLGAVENLSGVEVTDNALRAAGASIPLPREVLPCQPNVQRTEETLILSCTVEDVPPALVATLSAAAQRQGSRR